MKLKKIAGWGCAILLLAVSANAATTLIPGVLKREFWAGGTRGQIEAGTLASSNAVVTYPAWWDVVDGTQNYADRYSGVIIPDTTDNYDFFVAADDDSDLFISTNDVAVGKYMIAQETAWSGVRSWTVAGSGIA